MMRENLTNGLIPFRQAYLQSILDVVAVEARIVRIKGRKDHLEKAVIAGPAAIPAGSQMSAKWRTSQDKTANTYVIEI